MASFTLALGLASGCDRRDRASKPPPPAQAAPVGPKDFQVRGIVRKVDAASGEVTIAHEAIPGLMPRMTMPFFVKDKALLDDIRPGDEVEGPLRVTYRGANIDDIDLVDLTVTRPAPPPTPSFLPAAPPPETLHPGEIVPDFAVTTQAGGNLRLSDLRGEVVVLTFIYTRCPMPEFCPAMDAKFAELARRLSAVPSRAAKVRLLSVSFDPAHDTPEVLAAHAARRGATPPLWTFAVASPEELAKVAGPLGLSYVPGTREIEHNLRAAVIGPDGKLARLEAGGGWTAADLLKTILSLIQPTSG
jgi:protein SCO1/2